MTCLRRSSKNRIDNLIRPRKLKYSGLYIALIVLVNLSGCSVSKHIPPGESLYVGGSIKVQLGTNAKKDVDKRLEGQLTDLLRPVPNTTLFGYPYKVGL